MKQEIDTFILNQCQSFSNDDFGIDKMVKLSTILSTQIIEAEQIRQISVQNLISSIDDEIIEEPI